MYTNVFPYSAFVMGSYSFEELPTINCVGYLQKTSMNFAPPVKPEVGPDAVIGEH